MLTTRTGGFPIGFRRGWSAWQKDLGGLTSWAAANGMACVDLGGDADQIAAEVTAAGLKVGSADLKSWQALLSADPGKQAAAVDENAAYIASCAQHGIKAFFVVMLPEDPAKPRSENFALMVKGMQMLAPHLEKHGAAAVVEGWPGPGALACTPEGYRGLFREVPSPAMAVNFDPSHLIRMGIDAVRFLQEFAPRVKHVHGKDTELLAEGLYEYGHEQPPTFGQPRGFGNMSWRYTIPGHGCFRWTHGFEILRSVNYEGFVSIELEDEHFNTDEAGEKSGLLAGAQFLASC